MAIVNYAARQINCKVVYYGPGMGGKTTNLEFIYHNVAPETRGKLISLATEAERTLLFDFLPVDLGEVRGFQLRFHLYTVPGQTEYRLPRKMVMKGVDGVVFVADSGADRMESNLESMQTLHETLEKYGGTLEETPFVIQYNKRDLPNAMTVEELEARLNPLGATHFEAVAIDGAGVFETLQAVGRQVARTVS